MEANLPAVGGTRRAAIGILAFVASCVIGGHLLPNGLPVGVILFGLLLGSLTSLTAMGLVILYRSARIINFAQAEIGGLAAAVAVVMVAGAHLPYLLALPVGLAAALATGALIDIVVMRQLFQSPRLIVTVATIAVAQVVGALELGLPHAFAHLKPLTTFTTPFTASRTIGPIVFDGNDFVAMLVVPLVLIGLAWFFNRTTIGVAIRGAADSTDRATLLGIPVRRLSTITWVIAAGLSGIGAMLTAPILGPQIGLLGGPESLLAPLTAAVIARMENLTTAFVASLVIGVFQQAVFWSYPRASTVDVALFVLVLASLLLQRRRATRVDDSGLGGYVAVREVRRIPEVLRRLPEVRWVRVALAVALGFLVLLLPLWVSDSKRTLLAYVAIYGIFAVSLVVLTGWSGQISLGQFAFAGVGAGTAASLFVHLHADLFVCLGAAALVGAVTAVLIGIPATRLPGLFLAVTTLAFAVPVSTFLLNSSYFPKFVPSQLARPAVFHRINLDSALSFYFFCLVFLVAALALAHNYRRTRAGRVALAVRDNARGAAAYAVSPVRVKLTAFALAGALAGVAGGLYAIGLRGIGFSGFNPQLSLDVFVMVVIGGVGTLTGGLLGAAYLQGVQYFLRGAWQLLATGGGLLLVVMLFPGGLADLLYRGRDAALRRVAARHQLSVPSLAERAAFGTSELAGPISVSTEEQDQPLPIAGDAPLLRLSRVDAAYGTVPVLFGVDLDIADGEIVGLLGTNGAGKSTVLRVVSGLLKARRGTITYNGQDVTRLSPVERVKAGMVMVPSGRGVFPSLTVSDNLRLGAWLARRDRAFVEETTARIFELFPSLHLRLHTPAGLLSGGEQQMLTIAQALYCRPRLLMIDELSLGLAPIVVTELLGVIRRLAASGVTVVIVEQSVNLATTVAGRSVFMERGQVRFTGLTADLVARPDLVRSVFLGEAARPAPAAPDGGGAGPDDALDQRAPRKRTSGVRGPRGRSPLRRRGRAGGRHPRGRRGRDPRHYRRQRRREDNAVRHLLWLPAADQWPGRPPRPRRHRFPGLRASRHGARSRVPGRSAVPIPDGRRDHRRRPGASHRGARPVAQPPPHGTCRRLRERRRPEGRRPHHPVGARPLSRRVHLRALDRDSAGSSNSLPFSPTIPPSSSSTSRRRGSPNGREKPSVVCCSICGLRPGVPSSSSSTTCHLSRRSLTAWCACTSGRSSPTGGPVMCWLTAP